MSLEIDIQRAADVAVDLPTDDALRKWVTIAMDGLCNDAELSVRLVAEQEGRELNRRYRGKDRATNVLSFPVEEMQALAHRPLGDVVICAPVVVREALEQGKSAEAHWAHLCTHGVLHLLGYDHVSDADARKMEQLEVAILARMGYQDPYCADA